MTSGSAILTLFVCVALFAPWIAPYGPNERVGPVFAPPSSSHWLGLDDGGTDVLSQMIWGARITLLIGFAAALVSMIVGTVVGVAAGYFGQHVDLILMRITDYFLVIPDLLLAIIIAALWGATTMNLIIVIGLLSWTATARVLRAQTKSLRERVYVRRAKTLGGRDPDVIWRHIVPHVMPLLVATTIVTVASAIFAEAALAFLGLGDPNEVSWGRMIAHAFQRAALTRDAWWAIVPPGVAIAVVVVSCTLIGRGVENAVNPRLRASHVSRRSFSVARRAGVEPKEGT